ncbi:MAG: methyltransferase domain-containing protein [archaeon]|nr:methyltransferase domain-containing protein [archaeon]
MADKKFFLLSGERSTLPQAELRAIVETYDNKARFEIIDERVIIVDGRFDLNTILKRSAYVNAGGYLLTRCKVMDAERIINAIAFDEFMDNSVSFAASVFNLSNQHLSGKIETIIGSSVKRRLPNAKVSLKNPQKMVIGIIFDDYLLLGFTDYIDRKSWRLRRPRVRPFFHPSALYPKFARGLVNLSHVKEGEIILDPFCGTGSILIEASIIGIDTIGIDISMKMCKGAMNNLKHYMLESLGIINSDALMLPIKNVNAVVTDIPYGRCASSRGIRTLNLLQEFISQAEDIMPKGRYCVIVHPNTIKLNELDGFEIKERHEVYVHRTLTRAITMLRKK